MFSDSESNLSPKLGSCPTLSCHFKGFLKLPRLPDTWPLALDWNCLSHPGQVSHFSDGAIVMNALKAVYDFIPVLFLAPEFYLLTHTALPSIFKAQYPCSKQGELSR